jgi:hypothetical protein
MLSDYLFTPKDFYYGLKALPKILSLWDVLGIVILAFIFEMWALFINVSVQGMFFIFFAVILFHWHVDSRFSISLALGSLISVVLLLVLDRFGFAYGLGQQAAEQVAIWAFYFLAIGVIKQIWEHFREKREKRRETEEDSSTDFQVLSNEEAMEEQFLQGGEVREEGGGMRREKKKRKLDL